MTAWSSVSNPPNDSARERPTRGLRPTRTPGGKTVSAAKAAGHMAVMSSATANNSRMGFMKKSTGFALRPFNGSAGHGRFSDGSVFSPLTFSCFAAPATDQVATPFPCVTSAQAKIAAFHSKLLVFAEFRHGALIRRICLAHRRAENLKGNRSADQESDENHPPSVGLDRR